MNRLIDRIEGSAPGWTRGLGTLMDGVLLLADSDVHQRTRRLLGRAYASSWYSRKPIRFLVNRTPRYRPTDFAVR